MKDEQAKELLKLIEGAYPMFLRGDKEVIKQRVSLWRSRLITWDYEKTKKKINDYIDTGTYPPTIAEVKPYVAEYDPISLKMAAIE